jgi:hypothetical protein
MVSVVMGARWHGLSAAAAALAVAACSTSSGGGIGSPPPADAFVSARVGGGGGTCNLATENTSWLTVGFAADGTPDTVTDQSTTASGGTASVMCTVHPSGSGFDIQLSASVSGAGGGAITIASTPAGGPVTTSGGAGIAASFTSATGTDAGTLGPYTSSSCTLSFTYMGQPVPDSPPIAAGRIWGHVDCPGAIDTGQDPLGVDGGKPPAACPASADFLFEHCNQ